MPQPWQSWYHCNGTLKNNWLRGDDRGWRSRDHREHVEGDYKNPPPPNAYASQFQHSRNLMTEEPVVLETFEERKEVCRIMGGALLFYGVEFAELAVGAQHYHTVARFVAAEEKWRAQAEAQAAEESDDDEDDAEAQGDPVPATGVAGLSGVAGLCEAHMLKDGRNPLPRYILGKCHSWTSREFKKWLKLQQSSVASQSPATPVAGTAHPMRPAPSPPISTMKLPAAGLFAPKPKCNPIENERHFRNSVRYDYDHRAEGAAVWSILFGTPDEK